MKNLFILFLILLGISTVISCLKTSTVFIFCLDRPIRGNGNIITSNRIISSFDDIDISGSAVVRIHKDIETRVTLTVDSNLLEYIELEVKNTTLNIGTKKGRYSFTKFIVDIYCPDITGISISDSAKVELSDKIITPSFKTEISGSGRIEGIVESDNYSANISGSGNITIKGTNKDSDIKISGSGNFHGKELKTNNSTIKISGSGSVSIYVTDNLKADISGSGKITYIGTPKINYRGTGSGVLRSE
jgi:hypothetical protein